MIRRVQGMPVMNAVGRLSHLHWKVGCSCQHDLIRMLLLVLLLLVVVLLLLQCIFPHTGSRTRRLLHPQLPLLPWSLQAQIQMQFFLAAQGTASYNRTAVIMLQRYTFRRLLLLITTAACITPGSTEEALEAIQTLCALVTKCVTTAVTELSCVCGCIRSCSCICVILGSQCHAYHTCGGSSSSRSTPAGAVSHTIIRQRRRH
jgi:hypothetical protein